MHWHLWSSEACPSLRCTEQSRIEDGRPMTEVTVGRGKLEVVPYFCYLGDYLSSGGGCELAPVRPHLPLIPHDLKRKNL